MYVNVSGEIFFHCSILSGRLFYKSADQRDGCQVEWRIIKYAKSHCLTQCPTRQVKKTMMQRRERERRQRATDPIVPLVCNRNASDNMSD